MSSRYLGGIVSATAPTPTAASASGVWTVKEAEYYQKAGNWPNGSGLDAQFNYVTMLLHGDGTNGAQNNTFLDSSTNNYTITRNGNTTQGSFDPYTGPGCWSTYFNGASGVQWNNGGRVTVSATSTFTIESWIYLTATPTTTAPILADGQNNTATVYWSLELNTSRNLQFFWYIAGNVFCTSVGTVSLNQWTHVAVSVSAGAIKLFINGTLQSVTGTSTLGSPGTTVYMQSGCKGTGPVNYFTGYISNLRLTNNVALYSATFTPSTTPLVATSNTSLLALSNNSFNDMSASNAGATSVLSAPQASKFSPFTLYQTVPASYSGYFDGSGDYLSSPLSAAFDLSTGNWTIEAWVYPTSVSTGPIILNLYSSAGSNSGLNFWINSSNQLVQDNGVTGTTAAGTVPLNTWTHVAAVRNSGATQLYVNGTAVGATISQAPNSAQYAYIGRCSSTAVPQYFTGSISNVRVVKGQALYTANFTPSTTPLTTTSQGATAANVSLLTCQSTTFIDNSTNAFTITANGNATPKAANPFTDTVSGPTAYAASAYGGSAYFDGTGDYLTPSATPAAWGTSDFTVEFWIYVSVSGTYNVFDYRPASTNGVYFTFYLNAMVPTLYVNSANRITGSAIPAASWTHIAFARASGSTKMFVNGAQAGSTYADTNSYLSAANRPAIGTAGFDLSSSLNGYMSNIRVVNGTAVYTGPFVPPTTPVTAITNTQLLLNATNGGIFDNSTVNDLETVGSAQVNTTTVKYGTGSMYFNGVSGTGIRIASNPALALGAGDWTIECWAYYAAIGGAGNGTLYEQRDGANTAVPLIYLSGSTLIYYTGGAARITGGTMSTGQWYHIAVCRASGSTRMFVNGTQVGSTYTDATTYVQTPLYLGCDYLTTGNLLNGYIDDMRVTKGYARYTANFTPPAAAFPDR